MKGKTAFEKIVEAHRVKTLPDGTMVLRLDRRWVHEITTPIGILDARVRGCDVVFDPNSVKAMIDHVVPAKDTASAIQGKIMRDWSKEHGIEFLDVGRNGVCHAIIPERGWIRPGQIGILGDSHTCTYGAFCAFTPGVGTTEQEVGIITGLWVCPPQKVIRVNFIGNLPVNVFSKDLILALIARLGTGGATDAVLEISGPVIDDLSMDARMTMTNMTVEAGATCGMMMVDEKTINYLWPAIRKDFPDKNKALAELSKWNSDPDCEYARTVTFDVTDMVPMITEIPKNRLPRLSDVVSAETLAGKRVDQVYIGSCTNGRLEDLRIAAHIFEKIGKPVAEGVRCIIAPATQKIWMQAMEEGLFKIFAKANCCITNPTCGACLGMSNGVLAPGEVCLSTTNRNFEGRMGKGGMIHLGSPATAAITAINGVISVPTPKLIGDPRVFAQESRVKTAKPIVWKKKTFPAINYAELKVLGPEPVKDFSGKVFYYPIVDVNTDMIIPAKYLNEIKKEEMAAHCMEDAILTDEQRSHLRQCQILVALDNFGCGSSREHAPWALNAIGVNCVIAPSFARIFYNNMFNNGWLCIRLPKDQIELLLEEKPKKLTIDWEKGEILWDGEITLPKCFNFSLTDHQKELVKDGGSVRVMTKLAAELQKANLKGG